jgi:hypothetical protein
MTAMGIECFELRQVQTQALCLNVFSSWTPQFSHLDHCGQHWPTNASHEWHVSRGLQAAKVPVSLVL